MSKERSSIQVGPPVARKSRRFTPRSKTGCLTCRKRRVKCDETGRPCKKCIVLNLQCQQAEQGSVPRSYKTGPSNFPSKINRPTGVDWRIAPATVEANHQELRMFDVFRKQFASRIGGPIDKPFWTYDVLQAAQMYPAIWHSCLAVAAAFDKAGVVSRPNAIVSKSQHPHLLFIWNQYSLALYSMRSLMSQQSMTYNEKGAFILSCILITGLCSVMQNGQEAFLHARHCCSMYHTWDFRSKIGEKDAGTNGVISGVFLDSIIVGLEVEVIYKTKSTAQTRLIQQLDSIKPLDGPGAFRSITDAFYQLQPIIMAFRKEVMWTLSLGQAGMPFSQEHHLELSHWRKRLEAFQYANYYNPKSPEAIISRVHISVVSIMSRLCRSGVYVDDIKYIGEYVELLDLVESAIQGDVAESTRDGLYSPIRSYSIGFSYLATVVMVYCPSIRLWKRLIDMTLASDRRDGAWSNRAIAAIQRALYAFAQSTISKVSWNPANPCGCLPPDYLCAMHRVAIVSQASLKGDTMVIELATREHIKQQRKGVHITVSMGSAD